MIFRSEQSKPNQTIFLYFVLLMVLSAICLQASFVYADNFNKDVKIQWREKNFSKNEIKDIEAKIKKYALDLKERNYASLIKDLYVQHEIDNIYLSESEKELVFDVVPKIKIDNIIVVGNRNVKKKEILNVGGLKSQRFYSSSSIEKFKKNIKHLYQKKGFWNVELETTLQRNKVKRSQLILLKIKEHEVCKIKSISFLENTKKYLGNIYKSFPVKNNDTCDELKIKNKLKNFELKLRKLGYRSAKINNMQLDYHDYGKKAQLNVDLSVGKKIEFSFIGNRFVFDRYKVLYKAIGIDNENNFGESWLQYTAANKIKEFYISLGYSNPKVTYQVSETDYVKHIVFDIVLQDRYFIGQKNIVELQKTNLDMNEMFDFFALEKTKSKIFVQSEIEETLNSMVSFYQSKGYLKAKLKKLETSFKAKKKVDLNIVFDPGKQTVIEKYIFEGNTVFDNYEIETFLSIKKNGPLNYTVLKDDVENILNIYREKGFKNVSLSYPEFSDIKSGPETIKIIINEGEKYHFSRIRFSGNAFTKKKPIKKKIDLKSGQVYQPSALKNNRRYLQQSGFFQSVYVDEKTIEEDNKVDIEFLLKERKHRSLILRPGFSSDDGVRTRIEFSNINILGTGRQFNSFVRFNRKFFNQSVVERRVGFNYVEPNVFKKFNAFVGFFNERVDDLQYDLDRTTLSLGIENNFLSTVRPSLSWNLEFRKPFNVQTGVVLNPIDQQAARFGFLKLELDYDQRDNVINPEKGAYHQSKFEIYDNAFLSEQEFWKLYTKHNFYVPIYKRIRSVASLRFGLSGTYGGSLGSNIPIEKRYRIGGSTSFRGSRYNCIGGNPSGQAENCSNAIINQAPGGNSMVNYLLEILFPISETFDLALFTDGGNAFLTNSDFNLLKIRTAAGIGLRVNTFFGPVRFDYGVLLDRRTGEDFGTFHFSVGQF